MRQAHVEVVTCGLPMVVAFLAVGIIALAGAIASASVGGVVGWGIAAFAALIAVIGIGTFVLTVVGRYAGLPWLFTP